MQLFVIRHAIAEEAHPGQDDPARELTKRGERRFRQIVKGLRALDVAFERVVTSPWRRAAATAALLAPIARPSPVETELLTHSPDAELLALIAERDVTTAVVGHEPWLGELIGWLSLGDQRRGEALNIKKGGVVWLEGSAVPGAMMIRAILPPKVLRR